MSSRVAWILLGLWPVSGLLLSYVMRRRGHDLLSWGVLGAIFGPLTLALAIDHVRLERSTRGSVLRPGTAGPGPVSMLIGVDGSAVSDAAARRALHLFGPRVGRVTLARVLDFETGGRHGSAATARKRSRIEADLASEVETIGAPGAEALLLVGRPDEALTAAAVAGGFDLVVVATRSRSASRALLGSTATGLLRSCPVPVCVVGSAGTTPDGFPERVPGVRGRRPPAAGRRPISSSGVR